MPLYICQTPTDTLNTAARQLVASDVTRIHCELTGAPPTFVHVVFLDSEQGAPPFSVFGTIRSGRSDEVKRQLHTEMGTALASASGVETERIEVTTMDVPASWVMEGGKLLPEPGEEEAWMAEHHAATT